MKKFKKIWLASFLSIYLLAGLLLFIPFPTQAGMFDVTPNIDFKPQVGVPNSEFTAQTPVGVGTTGINAQGNTVIRSDLLARYINAFYQWGLSIVAVIAVVMLMAGGLMWIASSGDSGLVTKAKDMIIGSLTGMALLVGAWFFLNTINPRLTQLPALEMVIINKTVMGCCEYSDKARTDSEKNCQKDGGTYKLSETNQQSGEVTYYIPSGGKCALPGCCITDPGKPEAICTNRQESDCKSALLQSNSAVSYVTGSCAAQIKKSLCKQGDWCQGAENGSNCASGSTNYCYNGICFVDNFGKENEPCGTKPNAACSKEYGMFGDPNDPEAQGLTLDLIGCTKVGYTHDMSGGRSCNIGLACCYPE